MIYLAVWDHKHGTDMSAHVTSDGAHKQCATWARESVEEWSQYCDLAADKMSDEELVRNWGDITGFTEFFKVDCVALHQDDEENNWVVDTSHIGA